MSDLFGRPDVESLRFYLVVTSWHRPDGSKVIQKNVWRANPGDITKDLILSRLRLLNADNEFHGFGIVALGKNPPKHYVRAHNSQGGLLSRHIT